MGEVRVADDHWFFETTGAGRPLVLIPGLGSDVSELGPLIDALALHLQVTAVDNLGAGRSGRPPGPYTLARMAAGPRAVLTSGVGPAAVLGISLGSRIALQVALDRPDLVSRLILVSGGARVLRTPLQRLVMATVPRLPVAKGRYPQPYAAFRAQVAASQDADLTARLRDVSVPTLILHGRRDRVAPPTLARELHEGILGSTVEWFDGGHLMSVFGSQIGALADRVTSFVDGDDVER